MTEIDALIDLCTDILVARGHIVVRPRDAKRFSSDSALTPEMAAAYARNELSEIMEHGILIVRGTDPDGERQTAIAMFGDEWAAKNLLVEAVQQLCIEDDEDD